MISKNRKQRRRLRKAVTVHDHQEKRIKKLLPYG